MSKRLLSLTTALCLALALSAVQAEESDSSFGSAAGKAWDGVKSGSKQAWDGISEGGKEAWEATKEGSSDAWDATKEGSSNVWEATKEGAGKVGNSIGNAVSGE